MEATKKTLTDSLHTSQNVTEMSAQQFCNTHKDATCKKQLPISLHGLNM